jgi:DNA primase
MAVISKPFLDELRTRLTLSEIIGQRISITRKGREFQACCPFHNEKTPSFTINDDKGFYHCFGCGAHGDHIGFVMQHDNMPFMEAIETLAAQAGMEVPKPTPQDREKIDRQDQYYKLMDTATKWFTAQLFEPKNQDVLNYLRGRGLTDETIAAFRIGFAPDSYDALRDYLKSKGYSYDDMVTLCLLKRSQKGGDPYVFFRDRVMFPVTDKKGRVIAFGGRVVPDHMRPPKLTAGGYTPAKYMNSAETPLFQKGQVVYNMSNARQAAYDGERLIVAEGYADVTALSQAGFKGAVAPLGTALTESQISLLWDMCPHRDDGLKEPYLCFDGDNAGQRAAIRAMERILPTLRPGVSARFVFMPDGLDPDDLIRAKGKDGMNKLLDQALPLDEMIWRHLTHGKDFTRPELQANLSNATESLVLHIADRTIQDAYRRILKDKIFHAFRSKKTFIKAKGKLKSPVKVVKPMSRKDLVNRLILGILIQVPQLYDDFEDQLMNFTCQNQSLDQLRQTVISLLSDKHGLTHMELKETLVDSGIDREILSGLHNDVRLHASYVFKADDDSSVSNGLQELLGRMAV